MGDQQAHIAELEQKLADARVALEAERKARLEFVSLLTHELRVPMTSIKGYTDLLLKGIMGPINDPQTSFLKTIRSNIERMSRMVTDLSDINKANGAALNLTLQAVALAPVVEEAVAALKPALDEKGHSVRVELPADLPSVYGDRQRLVFILQRLLENAVQYTPSGGAISVTAEPLHEANKMSVCVRDTGFGIPSDEQDRIGEMFFRASDEKTRETTGNGLSLHLCHQLIMRQNGTLRFESSRDTGSAFYVTLPTQTTLPV